jgi:hypothetical protein
MDTAPAANVNLHIHMFTFSYIQTCKNTICSALPKAKAISRKEDTQIYLLQVECGVRTHWSLEEL